MDKLLAKFLLMLGMIALPLAACGDDDNDTDSAMEEEDGSTGTDVVEEDSDMDMGDVAENDAS